MLAMAKFFHRPSPAPTEHPLPIREKLGDLLDCSDSVIVHQTNMQSKNACGLAERLFQKYPEVNVYADRKITGQKLGGIVMRRIHSTQQLVCNLYGQDSPGKGGRGETKEMRARWFQEGLTALRKEIVTQNGTARAITSVGFPGHIGCGLGGGDWTQYETEIRNFAASVAELGVQVNIYWLKKVCSRCGEDKRDCDGNAVGGVWTCAECSRTGGGEEGGGGFGGARELSSSSSDRNPRPMDRWAQEIADALTREHSLNPAGTNNPVWQHLRQYQKEGVVFAIACGGRVLFGDDPGMGKTVQAIATAYEYREELPVLIVCPANVREVWRTEIRKFWPTTPDIQVVERGKERIRNGAHFVVVGYEMLRDNAHLQKRENGELFKILILDESHTVKNPEAQITRTILRLAKDARRLILLSGTPILNAAQEAFVTLQMVSRFFFFW